MTNQLGHFFVVLFTTILSLSLPNITLAQNNPTTTPNAEYIVTTYDSTTLLPPDTTAVIAGFDGDEAFGVMPTDSMSSTMSATLTDSIAYTPKYDPTHHFHPAEWIVPGAAAVFGALCVNTSWGKKLREKGHRTFSGMGLNKVSVDNYLQYAPAALVYGLNLCGVKGQHNFKDRTIILAMSYAMMATVVNVAKYTFKEKRPDTNAHNSFPSGHTATAFVGAEYLFQEYRATQPWIGYTAYAIATGVAYLRMHNDRHWANDVLAGAAVGMLSTKMAYWLYPKIFRESTGKKSIRKNKSQRANKTALFGMPYYQDHSAGINMALVF